MTQVTFYQLDDEPVQTAATQLVLQSYRNRQQVLIVCDDKQSAEEWDEHLWQQPTDAFIPHNLRGEGPPNGAPVMIAWQPANESAVVMLNVSETALVAQPRCRQIIEFVPNDEAGKQSARDRYKQYQKAGCQLQFKPMPKESNNG